LLAFFHTIILRTPQFKLVPYTTLFRSLILSDAEFTAIFDALAVLDETELLPVTQVAQGLDDLTIGDVGEIVSKGSHILRARLSEDRKSTRLNSSHVKISYAVFCLKKKI